MKKDKPLILFLSLLLFFFTTIPYHSRCSSDSGKDDLTTINQSFLPTPDDLPVEFGLRRRTTVNSVEVTWPSGIVQTLINLDVNQMITITESSP